MPSSAQPSSGITTRVSVATNGAQGNGESHSSAISADGRYIAFNSAASNLVSGDTNAAWDIFVHDRDTGVTTRVSVATNGAQGNGQSEWPEISADGRYVAFQSLASTLVSGDINAACDIFVHDRDTGATTRLSVATDGTPGNDASLDPAIGADGRYVAFTSTATNLVAADTNATQDIFVHDRDTGVTTRVSVATDGTEGNGYSIGPAISADGRYIAFSSVASNLVAGDTNARRDIFVHDRDTGVTTLVSVATDGTPGNDSSGDSAISADGRYVAFTSAATNLVADKTNATWDIFVHDRDTGVTTRVSVATDGSQGNDPSYRAAISTDGQYVAYYSHASNLVTDDTNAASDSFVHDRDTGVTTRVSVATDGAQGNGESQYPAISADARYIAFPSRATNLVAGDTNAGLDVFVRVRAAPAVIMWVNPASIEYGTALGATQLNATANVPGTFVYAPAAGTVLNVGAGQTLSVTFTPTDTASYTTAAQTVTIDVTKAMPVVTWANPASIVSGTALSVTQLNATANVPGTFVYTPPMGTVLSAGTGQVLSVTFTPRNTANYNTATKAVAIDVSGSTGVGDVTPPALLSLSWTPMTIDTSTGAKTITVTARITDDLSGNAGSGYSSSPSQGRFMSPSGKQFKDAMLDGSQRVSGTCDGRDLPARDDDPGVCRARRVDTHLAPARGPGGQQPPPGYRRPGRCRLSDHLQIDRADA